MNTVTDGYEQQLWEELNILLAEVVPDCATKDQAERAIMLAVLGHDPAVADLHDTIVRLAREGEQGYLRAKLDEDNPVSRARRRLYGKWA